MTETEKLFETRKDICDYNTSYPLHPSDWSSWKTSDRLSFDDIEDLSFYIHIPFCQSLCRYCEYIKYKKTSASIERQYLDIVEGDMLEFAEQLTTGETILRGFDIGGGTPTVLSTENFAKLIEMSAEYARRFKRPERFQGSIEATFNTIDESKIAIMSKHTDIFSRISFGLQSTNCAFLRDNNRDNGQIQRMTDIFHSCRQQGISTINLDLMYGFVSQTKEEIEATMKVVERLKPEHLTVYELRTNMLSRYPIATVEQRFEQYSYLYDVITGLGYKGRFGMNTFSLVGDDGLSSYLQHRMIKNGAYKGFGIAAQSKNNTGISYNIGKNEESLESCLSKNTFEKGGDSYRLPPRELLSKYVAISGYCGMINLSVMEKILHADPNMVFEKELGFLLNSHYIEKEGTMLYLTPKGFLHYGAVLSLFYNNKS
ncbi:MAG: radical SAM protein [Prevotella sp.]|nr:radical SAM protein [Prevotella sp.]